MDVQDVRDAVDAAVAAACASRFGTGINEEAVNIFAKSESKGRAVVVIEGGALEFVRKSVATRLACATLFVGNARAMSVGELVNKIVAFN
ncbi:MAG: hypothetical protein WCF77_04430 [Minisyncoccia bacterium]|jgi:phosphoserine phosphatase